MFYWPRHLPQLPLGLHPNVQQAALELPGAFLLAVEVVDVKKQLLLLLLEALEGLPPLPLVEPGLLDELLEALDPDLFIPDELLGGLPLRAGTQVLDEGSSGAVESSPLLLGIPAVIAPQ